MLQISKDSFDGHPTFHATAGHVLIQHTYWVWQVRSCAQNGIHQRPNRLLIWESLTTILVKLHFETFGNEFTHGNETILHFWNMKNLGNGCV